MTKTIKVNSWVVKMPLTSPEGEVAIDPKTNQPIIREIPENTIRMVDWILQKGLRKDQAESIDKARQVQRIYKAINKAEVALSKNEEDVKIEFELDRDFQMINKYFKNYIPAEWGSNPRYMEEVESIIED